MSNSASFALGINKLATTVYSVVRGLLSASCHKLEEQAVRCWNVPMVSIFHAKWCVYIAR